MDREQIKLKATKLLHQVGVPAHLTGYPLLREAIVIATLDITVMNSVTKDLYPILAERFDIYWRNAERSMRYAIEVGWNRGNPNLLYELFGYTVDGHRGRPTNSEFIAMLAYKIMDEIVSE